MLYEEEGKNVANASICNNNNATVKKCKSMHKNKNK